MEILITAACLLVLVFPSIQVWRARTNNELRARIEKSFRWLMVEGKGLFDKNAEYTWVVQWYQWAAIPTAALIIIPGELFWNLVEGVILAVVLNLGWHLYFWWKTPVAKSTSE